VGRVGDPEFGAVEDVAALHLLGLQLHPDNVGARPRLSYRGEQRLWPLAHARSAHQRHALASAATPGAEPAVEHRGRGARGAGPRELAAHRTQAARQRERVDDLELADASELSTFYPQHKPIIIELCR